MKYTTNLFILLLFILGMSACQSDEKPTDEVTPKLTPMEKFTKYFEEIPAMPDTLEITHWQWSDESNTLYKGTEIPDSIYSAVLDSSLLQGMEDQWLYGISHFALTKHLEAYLVRKQVEYVNYDQSTYLFIYDKISKRFITVEQVAQFMGYEGFISETKSWICDIDKDGDKDFISSYYEWSMSADNGEEQEITSVSARVWSKDKYIILNMDEKTEKQMEAQYKVREEN